MPAPQPMNPASQLAKAVRQLAGEFEPPLTAGSCVLGNPASASLVQSAFLHFDGERYHLRAWCVMPNHVQVIVRPFDGWGLSQILHSCKSFTATEINRALGRRGTLWERESFDQLVRSPDYLEAFVDYVHANPVEAGLCATPKDWHYSSCGAGFQPAAVDFINPGSTPFVDLRSRGELPHLEKPGGTYFVTWRLLDAVVLNSSYGR